MGDQAGAFALFAADVIEAGPGKTLLRKRRIKKLTGAWK